ncbi:hypothetical protein KCU89_g21, partial [Aureobasidium melanogenum]
MRNLQHKFRCQQLKYPFPIAFCRSCSKLTMSEITPANDAPWHAAYPDTKSVPSTMTRAELFDMMNSNKKAGVDYVLVDLRRADHEGGTISGSINLPAQSLYPTIPTLYAMFKAAGISKVIWYCGSSRGRGTRAAAWFADFVDECKEGDAVMESVVLLEGIKGWASAGDEFTTKMQGFDATFWK